MTGILLRLSQKIGVDGRAQVIVKLTIGPRTRPCFKSGVYIRPEWMKATKVPKGYKYSIMPPTGSRTFEVYDAIDAKNRLDTFCNMLLRICQITEEHDRDKLTRDWIYVIYTQLTKQKVAPREITYSLMEQIYNEELKRRLLPKKLYDKSNFFQLITSYIKSHPQGTTAPRLLQLSRILARYEHYIQLTKKKHSTFKLDVEAIDQLAIIDINDYLLHEKEYIAKSGKLLEIIKPHPDLPPWQHPITFHLALGRGQNTVACYMTALKTFFNWLQDMEIIDKDPFKGFINKVKKYGIPYYLTIEERNQIAKHKFSDVPTRVNRDLFIFQCLVGCRYGDLKKLTMDNIDKDMLQYYPQKTKDLCMSTLVKVPLCKKAQELIANYAGMDNKGRLFPVPCPATYNKYIKKIVKACGITRFIPVRNPRTGEEEMKRICDVASSHMARRTFIGAAYKAVKDPNLIGKMSGHVEGSKAFNRYRSIDEEDLKEVIDSIQ